MPISSSVLLRVHNAEGTISGLMALSSISADSVLNSAYLALLIRILTIYSANSLLNSAYLTLLMFILTIYSIYCSHFGYLAVCYIFVLLIWHFIFCALYHHLISLPSFHIISSHANPCAHTPALPYAQCFSSLDHSVYVHFNLHLRLLLIFLQCFSFPRHMSSQHSLCASTVCLIQNCTLLCAHQTMHCTKLLCLQTLLL